MTRRRWHQRTFQIHGCRVRTRWSDDGRWRIRVTDPTGSEERERTVMALVAGVLAWSHTEHGIGFTITSPAHIDDHGGAA